MKARALVRLVVLAIIVVIAIAWFWTRRAPREATKEAPVMAPETIVLESPAFKEGEMIPAKYTCDGANVSPPLSWSGVPRDAKAQVLVCIDPDAPRGTWTHWVLWDLAPAARKLLENLPTQSTLASGARQNLNDFKKVGYGGPCPPSGTHRYFFTIYALSQNVDLANVANKDIPAAIEKYVLAQGQLMGKYTRRS